jgi:hypothetical protein
MRGCEVRSLQRHVRWTQGRGQRQLFQDLDLRTRLLVIVVSILLLVLQHLLALDHHASQQLLLRRDRLFHLGERTRQWCDFDGIFLVFGLAWQRRWRAPLEVDRRFLRAGLARTTAGAALSGRVDAAAKSSVAAMRL